MKPHLLDQLIKQAAAESTCKKRVTVCVLFDRNGEVITVQSNRCDPPGGKCQRLNTADEQVTYPTKSECNWTHAEIMAVRVRPWDWFPRVAHLYGHNWPCPSCEDTLRYNGVEEIKVFPNWWGTGLRRAM